MKLCFLSLLFLAIACEKNREEKPSYRPAVATRLAAVETECPALSPRHSPQKDPSLEAQVRDLLEGARVQSLKIAQRSKAELVALGSRAIDPILLYSQDESLDVESRLTAISWLGALGSREAVEVLLGMAESDPDPYRRLYAADALGRSGAAWALPRFLLRLKYERDPLALVWVVSGLARLGSYAGLPELFRPNDLRRAPATDPDQTLATALDACLREILAGAGTSLAEDATAASVLEEGRKLADSWEQGQLPPAESIPAAPCLEKEILLTVRALAEKQLRNVDDARYRLQRLQTAAIPSLLLGLEDENFYIRSHSIEVLGKIGVSAKSALPSLLRSAVDPLHRADVFEALGRIRSKEAVPALVAGLTEQAAEFRLASARALGRIGDASAAPSLRDALRHWEKDRGFRLAASCALIELGSLDVMPALLRALEDAQADPEPLWATIERAMRKRRESLPEETEYFEAPDRPSKLLILRKIFPENP